jgi:hypothetical protein
MHPLRADILENRTLTLGLDRNGAVTISLLLKIRLDVKPLKSPSDRLRE